MPGRLKRGLPNPAARRILETNGEPLPGTEERALLSGEPQGIGAADSS